MRIFVSYIDESGTKKVIRLSINQMQKSTQFLKQIASKICIHRKYLIVSLIDAYVYPLRIIDGWQLSEYPIKNNSRFEVKFVQSYSQMIDTASEASTLKTIDELNQKELYQQSVFEEDNSTNSISQFKGSQQKSNQSYFDDCLQRFLQAVRSSNLQKMAEIIRQEPDAEDYQKKTKIFYKKNTYIINQLGQQGWSAIHWAIQSKNIIIVDFLLVKGCLTSTVSLDGYTPLQLAISLGFTAGIKTLLQHHRIDINQQTKRGTSLHEAVQKEDLPTIKLLLAKGADVSIKNQDGKTPLQLSSNKQIKNFLATIKQQTGRVQTPYYTKGRIYTVSSLSYRLKQRQMLINPFHGSISIYNGKQKESQLQVVKVIQLKLIKQNEKKWLMKSQYTYFQIVEKNKYLLAVKHEQIAKQWLQMLNQALRYIKSPISHRTIKEQQQFVRFLNDEKNQITHHRRKKMNKTKQMGKTTSVSVIDLPVKDYDEQEVQKHFKSEKKANDRQRYSTLSQESQIILGTIIGEQTNYQQPFYSSTDHIKMYKHKNNPEKPIVQAFKIKQVVRPRYNHFLLLKLLGNGSFGKVFLAKHKKTNIKYALKVLNKKQLSARKQLKYAITQANILKKVESPFIIKLHYSFQTQTNMYMALDYCSCGDLSMMIAQKERLSEKVAKFLIAQIILAISYLHNLDIIYRDLKPENILIRDNGYICLIDFGLSRQKAFSMSFCGSPAYLSPEMLNKKGVGKQNDIYGIGCVFYEMLSGEPPYLDEDINKLFENIKSGMLKYPSHLTTPAKSLISQLLERDISKRLGVSNIEDIKKHEFFRGFDWNKLISNQMKCPAQFLPEKQDEIDLDKPTVPQNFDIDYQTSNAKINRIKNFTFSRHEDSDSQNEECVC